MKPRATSGAHEVAGDHEPFAVETIEQHSGERAHGDGREAAGQQDAGDHQAGMGKRHGQGEDGDVIEIVADFTDNLAHSR